MDSHKGIINGLIPWQKINGSVYYIDCDATSFRCILNALKYPDDISSVNDLGPMDFKLLQRTKDYLMINDRTLNSAIDNYVRKENEVDLKNFKNGTLFKCFVGMDVVLVADLGALINQGV